MKAPAPIGGWKAFKKRLANFARALSRKKADDCPVCGGSGEFRVGDETGVCGFCHGERKVSEEEKGE